MRHLAMCYEKGWAVTANATIAAYWNTRADETPDWE
jgi:TPR repeat protein